MLVTNWKNMPDAPLPPDNSDMDAARDAAHEALVEIITDERMQSAAWVSDAQGDFSQAEYDAVTAAIVAGDAMQVGMLTIGACRRVVAVQAESEAERRVELMEREDEADYYSAAVAV